MPRILLTLLCALLFSITAYSQGFRPGFIVQTDGDTIQGLVKYREGSNNYKSCIFKPSEEAEAKEYMPGDLTAYGMTGDSFYESKEFTDAKNEPLKAFIEVLVHGKLNLYQYKELLFLEKDLGGLKPLRLETDDEGIGMVVTGERKTITTSTQHLILLNSLMLDCTVSEKKMAKLLKRLNVPDVVAVVEDYNNCIAPNSSVAYKNNKSWVTIEKGVFAGNYATALKFDYPNSFNKTPFPLTHSLVVGALLNFKSPMRSERWSVQLEPLYSMERYTGKGSFNSSTNAYIQRNEYDVAINRLSLASMVRYTMTTKSKITPYFAMGMSSNYTLSSEINGTQETEWVSTGGNKQPKEIKTEVGNGTYYSGTAAVGAKYSFTEKQEVLIQIRYEHGRYITNGPALFDQRGFISRDSKSFYLTAAYILK